MRKNAIPDVEVVVIGAGPVGLAVACGLARAGRRVIVLENDESTAAHSRAPAIWPRSQEILASLGVLDAMVAHGITLDTVQLRDADSGDDDVILSIPVHELADTTPYPRMLILPQSETERLLYDAVRAQPTAEVQFGAEATDIDQDDVGVRVIYRQAGATRAVRAAFVAGCDGARSTVRERIGAAFDGKTYGMRAALADIAPRLHDSHDSHNPHNAHEEPDAHEAGDLPFPRLSTRGGLAVAIRMSERTWRLILPFGEKDERDLDDRVENAAARLFPHVRTRADYRSIWQSEFRLHRRLASKFVEGRIALAGDAAHLNSPVGGQGMNAGIADAAALTDALLRALERGDARPLRDYEKARMREVRQGVNAFTDRMTRLLVFRGGRAIRPMFAAARSALRVPSLRRRLLLRVAMLDRAHRDEAARTHRAAQADSSSSSQG